MNDRRRIPPEALGFLTDADRIGAKRHTKSDPLSVLDTVPTGHNDKLTHDMWDQEWIQRLEACAPVVPRLSDKDLARALCWAHTHSCYYHSELCDLLETCVAEAAHRLRGEKTR